MTSPPPVLSVVMPMQDVALYVAEAVRSVLNQDWRDLELIIVDDGSTDNSRQIAQAACADDPRATIVAQARQGQSAARNRALDMARGRYVYFFDSDDVLVPGALTACIERAQRLDLDMVAFSGTAFRHDEAAPEPLQVFRKPSLPDPMSGQNLLVQLYVTRSFSVSCCLYVFARKLVEDPPLRFDAGFIHEDESFTALLYCAARRAIAIEDVLFRRRIRTGSTMTRPRARAHVAGCLKAAERLAHAIDEKTYLFSPDCLAVLRHRQRTLLRQAVINAELSGTKAEFRDLLTRSFGAGNILRIDPLIVPFALWCAVLNRLGRLPTGTC